MNNWIHLLIITLIPGIELRGSIPIGIAEGMDPLTVILITTTLNVLIAPIGFMALDFLWDSFFAKIGFFSHHLEKNRKKAARAIEKYGYLGLLLFVAIPFPGTGAYTGTLVAWALGMKRARSSLVIGFGVVIAAAIVSMAMLGVMNLF